MAPISMSAALTAALLASSSVAVPIISPFNFNKVSNGFHRRSTRTKWPSLPVASSGYHIPLDKRDAPYAIPESHEKRSPVTGAEPAARDPETKPYQYFKRDATPVSKSYPSSGYHLPLNLKERSTAPYDYYQSHGQGSPEKRSTGAFAVSPAAPSTGFGLSYLNTKRKAHGVAHPASAASNVPKPDANAKLPKKPRSPKAVKEVPANVAKVEEPAKTEKQKRDESERRYAMAQWMNFPM